MTKSYILFEHALGYALLRVKAADVNGIVDQAKELLHQDDAFCKAFKLHSFNPFSSSSGALQNCNAISEGVVDESLKDFLMENLPLHTNIILCVAERKLAEALKAPEMDLPDGFVCAYESALNEVYRAIRLHFPTYIRELSHFAESKAQIGLGHSYSRAKVKFNVHRNDNMIIQTINLLDQLDKDINAFCMRIKEWFSYHFPELHKLVPDSANYVKVIGLINNRDGATEEAFDDLESIVGSETARSIIDCAKTSFGFDITEDDSTSLASFTEKILSLIERRKNLQSYLTSKLTEVAPNLSTIIGDRVSARLISHAGSLMNLAKFPASTIQILGAEKALFRALRCRGNTPKYGLLYHCPFIARAARQNKGRISRFIAAKCAIASRLDCFSEILCDVYGRHLKQQVEDRLKYFETGEVPITNAEAMSRAVAEANKYIRKMKKRSIAMLNNKRSPVVETVGAAEDDILPKTKRKKRPKTDGADSITASTECDVSAEVVENMASKKKKKRRALSESVTLEDSCSGNLMGMDGPSLNRSLSESSLADIHPLPDSEVLSSKKKRKQRRNSESAQLAAPVQEPEDECRVAIKNERKRTVSESSANNAPDNMIISKKKKHRNQ